MQKQITRLKQQIGQAEERHQRNPSNNHPAWNSGEHLMSLKRQLETAMRKRDFYNHDLDSPRGL